jgi:deoxycytidylate deaminase
MTRSGPPITFADFVDLALEMSTNSPCQKSKRGAVAFRDRELVAVGWNHRPGGEACDGSEDCRASCRREAVHAEQVLVVSTANLDGADVIHVKSIDGALVASGGPSCGECAKLLRAAAVAAVWLYHADGWRRYPIAEFHRLSIEAGR